MALPNTAHPAFIAQRYQYTTNTEVHIEEGKSWFADKGGRIVTFTLLDTFILF